MKQKIVSNHRKEIDTSFKSIVKEIIYQNEAENHPITEILKFIWKNNKFYALRLTTADLRKEFYIDLEKSYRKNNI